MKALELLAPSGLWLLAAIAPLVAMYVLKIRRERVRVPSTWLWGEAQRDLLAKQPFKRLQREVPLLLELLALLALAVALARPATRGGAIAGDHVAIVIDTSASMLATSKRADGSATTRIDEAKDAARDIARRLSPGADAFVIAADHDARALTPLERDPRAIEAAIARVEAHEVEGDLASAVALAADRLRSLPGSRRIVLVTDGAVAHAEPLATGGIDAQIVTVGTPADNAAIVRIDARSGVDPATKREEAQVFAMVESFGDRPREAYVTLSISDHATRPGGADVPSDGRTDPIASRRVMLAPHEKTPVVLTFEPRAEDDGKALAVQIAPHDALAADDVAYARVPARRGMPVVLASSSKYSWLARALRADPEVDLRTVDLGELAKVDVDAGALVVVEGACPGALPGRDVLVVAPPEGSCLGVGVGALVETPRVTSWESSDPRLRFLTLDGVHVARTRALDASGPRAAIVRSDTTALVADASTPGRAATIVGFDVGDSDWPLQASFVLFVRDVVELARAHREQGASAPARTGEPLRVAVPPDVKSVRVEGPGAVDLEVAAKDGFAIVPPLDRAGAYRVRWVEPHVGSAIVPVNLASERESDPRVRPLAIDTGTGAAPSAPRAADAHHEWSAWLALVAALALAFEIVWLTRTARGARSTRTAFRAIPIAVGVVAVLPLAYEGLVFARVLRESYVRFDVPIALVGVALLGIVVAWRFSRMPARMGDARRVLFASLASMAVLAASLAVARPSIGRPLDRLTLLVAIDRSRSIDLVPGAEARAHAEIALAQKGMREGDCIGTVVFGAEAATEDPPHPRTELAPPQHVTVPRDGTDIDAAMRRALAEIPADSAARVVLVTDGVETRGDALSGASVAVAAGVPVDAIALDQKPVHDVRIVSVRAPPHADRDEPIELRIVTSSAVATDVEVRISRDGEPLHDGTSRAPPGGGQHQILRTRIAAGEDVLRLREAAGDAGLHRYDVAITALDPSADQAPEDNAGSAFVKVRGAALALVLEGDPGKGAPMDDALRASGFLVEERSTTGVPADVGGLAAFDLVILSDIRASDLAPSQIDALASYTRDLGGGLVVMGGDRSMGPGGYARTPLEEVSPVSFDLKEEKRRASLAEVIAIDYSGSMGMIVSGQTKLALANEAAARSASLLGPGDRLGVEHVDTEVRWTVPLGPVTDVDGIGWKIRRTSVGGGGIYTDIALRAGYEALEREKVNLKHLLLFADGSDAEQINGCRAIVKSASARGITTSVISLGRGSDSPELEALSKVGGGRFYLIDDATKLPAVFTQETILATKSALHEDPFRVSVSAPSGATRGIDFASAPPLGGYIVTVPKPRATIALTGPDGDPVLASWSVGLGRAAAFTSDYKDRWGRAWLGWPGAAKAFGQVGRDVARKDDDPRVRLESDATGGELHVRADVVGDDGRAQTFRRLSAHVAGPDGFARDVPLEAIGAGRYEASVPLSRPGTYLASAADDATGELVGTTGAALAAGEELRPTGSDRALLARVASMTGGKMRDTLAGVFDDRAARRFAYQGIAPFLSLVAGLAMLFGVGARKLGVPEAWAKKARAEQRTPAIATARSTSTSTRTSTPTPASTPTSTSNSPRPLTAAERLALKRRGNRR